MKGVENTLADLVTFVKSNMGKHHSSLTNGEISRHVTFASSNATRCVIEEGVLCEIKGLNGKVIAKGTIYAIFREKVHSHTFDYEQEVVVILDTIFDLNDGLYLGQQGGPDDLRDVGTGVDLCGRKHLSSVFNDFQFLFF